MNNFEAVSLINKQIKKEVNALYDDYESDYVKKGLEICGFRGNKAQKIAILRRIVDLSIDPIFNEFKKLGYSQEKQNKLRDEMYDYTRMIHENFHRKLIAKIQENRALDAFYLALVVGVHRSGLVINELAKEWQKTVIDITNTKFQQDFDSILEAKKFITQNELYQKTPRGEICDRIYGVVVFEDNKFEVKTYAQAFKSGIVKLQEVLQKLIETLNDLADDEEKRAYITYFEKLCDAFCQKDNQKAVGAWRDAEMAWMDVKSPIQVGHPLEYYEDMYTHSVALEWDIRLKEPSSFDADKFKNQISQTFDCIYEKIGADNYLMNTLVHSNIDKTHLYISSPFTYYGATLNGLFSAQVVPNDEFVSMNCGKKIFAFADFIYENAKSKPFMRLNSEIFSQDFLDFGREILFKKPEIWKRVYEISTIGHEFGHILFIDENTEAKMNKSGAFKLIEEFKATSGGLMSFFLHEESELVLPVFVELIKRSVGLIAWQNVSDLQAYYCEGLLHLTLLFEARVLYFDNGVLDVKFDQQSYEMYKEIAMKNYEELAQIYTSKEDALVFLSKFLKFEDGIYLPLNYGLRKFVEFYSARYKQIGNEVDESNEKQRWL